jgi:predicted nucleotidyltransferase
MSQKKDTSPIFLFKESMFQVAKCIFTYPNKTFHVRMLANETKLSTTAVVRSLEELEQFQIITVEETSLTKNVKANLSSHSYPFYKTIFNLYLLKKSGIIENLVQIFKPQTIVLFGSFAKGEDIEESDIDLFIQTSQQKEISFKQKEEYEKILSRGINIHCIPSLQQASNEFKNALANGIVLYGYLKVL